MSNKKPSPTAHAAAELGLTRRRIQQKKADGTLDSSAEMSRLRRLEKEVTIELRRAQEQQIQVELKRKARIDAGELIHSDVATPVFVGALLEIKAQLVNLPDRLSHQLCPDNPEFARRLLWSELARISELVQTKIEQHE
jgi:hypothetical protein